MSIILIFAVCMICAAVGFVPIALGFFPIAYMDRRQAPAFAALLWLGGVVVMGVVWYYTPMVYPWNQSVGSSIPVIIVMLVLAVSNMVIAGLIYLELRSRQIQH